MAVAMVGRYGTAQERVRAYKHTAQAMAMVARSNNTVWYCTGTSTGIGNGSGNGRTVWYCTGATAKGGGKPMLMEKDKHVLTLVATFDAETRPEQRRRILRQ